MTPREKIAKLDMALLEAQEELNGWVKASYEPNTTALMAATSPDTAGIPQSVAKYVGGYYEARNLMASINAKIQKVRQEIREY